MRADRRRYFVLRLVGYLAMDVRPEFLDQGQLASVAAPDWLQPAAAPKPVIERAERPLRHRYPADTTLGSDDLFAPTAS
jgi:hypothetical protein